MRADVVAEGTPGWPAPARVVALPERVPFGSSMPDRRTTVRLLTVPETADILRLTPGRVYELARTGILPVVRLGRQIRVDAERLDEFLKAGGQALPGGWRAEG